MPHIPRRHNYGVLEYPGVKTLNIYKNRLLFFSTPQALCIPHPNGLKILFFFLSYIKGKHSRSRAGIGGEGAGSGPEYWRATRGWGNDRDSGVGGFTRNPQSLLDETRGFLAPTRAAPPRTAPSPALASSSPAQLNCIYLISAVTLPPPRHTDTIPPFSNPLSSPSLLLAFPGLHREPPAAPAATETCAPSSKRGHRSSFPSAPAIFVLSPSSPLPPAELQLPKEGSLETSAGRSTKGNLKLPSGG